MRTRKPPSEIRRLAAPLARVLDGAWQRMHWWIAIMAVLYACSGMTVVRPDETAVVLRWGRLVGDTPGLQEHGPGLLFAFPRPIDQVVRVQVKHIWEVPVTTLEAVSEDETGGLSLDSLKQGYAVTGDENVIHVNMVARYRVREPAEYSFYGPAAEDILRVEVTSAMVRSMGEMGVDRVLSDGRKNLIDNTARRAQAGLDQAHSGLELSSLELVRLVPPAILAGDFDAVQSAFINAETEKKQAQAFAESAVPEAQAQADADTQTAHGKADADLAQARGEAAAFLALDKEYRVNRAVVRERLYRDAMEKSLGKAGQLRWIPPPVGGNYHGFRITIGPFTGAATAPDAAPSAPPADSPTNYPSENE